MTSTTQDENFVMVSTSVGYEFLDIRMFSNLHFKLLVIS